MLLQLFQMELHCVQRHGETVMEEVNCTETLSMTTPVLAKTQTTSSLLLLRAQPGVPTITGNTQVIVSLISEFQFLRSSDSLFFIDLTRRCKCADWHTVWEGGIFKSGRKRNISGTRSWSDGEAFVQDHFRPTKGKKNVASLVLIWDIFRNCDKDWSVFFLPAFFFF